MVMQHSGYSFSVLSMLFSFYELKTKAFFTARHRITTADVLCVLLVLELHEHLLHE